MDDETHVQPQVVTPPPLPDDARALAPRVVAAQEAPPPTGAAPAAPEPAPLPGGGAVSAVSAAELAEVRAEMRALKAEREAERAAQAAHAERHRVAAAIAYMRQHLGMRRDIRDDDVPQIPSDLDMTQPDGPSRLAEWAEQRRSWLLAPRVDVQTPDAVLARVAANTPKRALFGDDYARKVLERNLGGGGQ